jgi:hypothetical protein
MKQTIANWYANKHSKLSPEDAADPNILVKPCDCGKLAEYAIKIANKQFIGMCPGLSGNHSLIEAVDIMKFIIDLIVLALVHEAIIVDDQDDSSNEDDSEDEDGAEEQESE